MESKISKQPKDKVSIDAIVKALSKKGFRSIVLHSDKEVKDFLNKNIPDETPVGLGDSITSCKLNLRNILATKGTKIFYSWNGSDNYNRSLDTFDNHIRPDYFITRITALTVDGRLLMKDYDKSAAAENKFPENIFAFVGLNRLVEEFDSNDNELKYPVVSKSPAEINFTVAILPFLDY